MAQSRKLTDEQIVGYFRQAVEAIGADVPGVLQDSGVTAAVLELSSRIDSATARTVPELPTARSQP